jgi:hypothetical protein
MLFQKSENKTSAKNSTDLTDKKISTISTGPFWAKSQEAKL